MEFRNANLDDIFKLADLRVKMINEEKPYSDDYNKTISDNTVCFLEQCLQNDSVDIIVAVTNGDIIAMGCVNYFLYPPNDWCPNGKTAYIGNVYTDISYRKNGIATKILNLLVEKAKCRSCQRILLDTSDMGKTIYQKFGFEYAPTTMKYFPFGIIPEEL